MESISVNGPASWNTTFEKLLADPAGLHTFSVSYFFLYILQIGWSFDGNYWNWEEFFPEAGWDLFGVELESV